MARNENPPFQRGETYGTTDATVGKQYEGKEYVFEDVSPLTGLVRSNRYVKCRIIRNVSTVALRAKGAVRMKLGAGATVFGSQSDGYGAGLAARVGAERVYLVDEYLTAGCPVNDLCFIVIEGPALATTPLDNMGEDIAVGDRLALAQTAAATTGTTGGRVEAIVAANLVNNTDMNATTQAEFTNSFLNQIGLAMSAALTNSTSADILVDVGKW